MAFNGTGVNEAIAVVLKAAKAVAGEKDDFEEEKYKPADQIESNGNSFKISQNVFLVFIISGKKLKTNPHFFSFLT